MAEIDVQQTHDGVLIVLHDSSFKRTTGFGQNVWDTDYATVRTLDAGVSFSTDFMGEHDFFRQFWHPLFFPDGDVPKDRKESHAQA